MICSWSVDSPQHSPAECSNKLNPFAAAYASDSDPDYTFTALSSPQLTEAALGSFGVSAGSGPAALATSESGTDAVLLGYATALTQSNCSSPIAPYSSIGVFTGPLSVAVSVQAGTTKRVPFLEPCLVPPNSDTLTFSVSGSNGWTSYDSTDKELVIVAPSSGGPFTETLSTTTTNSDNLVTFFDISLYD